MTIKQWTKLAVRLSFGALIFQIVIFLLCLILGSIMTYCNIWGIEFPYYAEWWATIYVAFPTSACLIPFLAISAVHKGDDE